MNKEKQLQCGNLTLPITTEQNNGKKINIFSFLIDLAYVGPIYILHSIFITLEVDE